MLKGHCDNFQRKFCLPGDQGIHQQASQGASSHPSEEECTPAQYHTCLNSEVCPDEKQDKIERITAKGW